MKNLSSMVPVQYRPISIFTAFAMFLMAILVLTSCTETNHYVDVTVIGTSTKNPSNWVSDLSEDPSTLRYDVVTPSGDTMTALVDRSIASKNAIPYKTKMRMNDFAKYGFIQED